MSLNKLKATVRFRQSKVLPVCYNACFKLITHHQTSQHRHVYESATNKVQTPSTRDHETEDFYGIPESFRLQNVYVRVPNKDKVESSTINSQEKASPYRDVESNNDTLAQKPLSRKERRRIKQMGLSYYTSFGIVSFDPETKTSNSEEHSVKVQNVFDNIFQKPKAAQSSTIIEPSRSQDITSQSKSSNKSVLMSDRPNHNNILSSQQTPISDTINSNPSTKSSGELNFIDEAFFPELTSPTCTHSQTSPKQDVIEKRDISFDKGTDSRTLNSENTSRLNEFDEQYFGTYIESKISSNVKLPEEKEKHEISYSENNINNKTAPEQIKHNFNSNLNEIDEQYFGDTVQNSPGYGLNVGTLDNKFHGQDISEVISNYPIYKQNTTLNEKSLPILKNDWPRSSDQKKESSKALKESLSSPEPPRLKELKESTLHTEPPKSKALGSAIAGTENTILSSKDFISKRQPKKKVLSSNTDENAETAYDVAMKIRQSLKSTENFILKDHTIVKDLGKNIAQSSSSPSSNTAPKDTAETEEDTLNKKLDSKGFKIPTQPLLDFDKMTKADLTLLLKSKIIFDHEDFLAIDKPYGLPCIGQKQDRVSIIELLPSFINLLPRSYKTSELHLVQGLDRDVTGAVILAKNPEVAAILRSMYDNSEEVIQRFWAITKGVPSQPKGLIDIPIGEGKVGNIYKMMLRPRYNREEKEIAKVSRAPSERAMTEYEVLDRNLQSALVQCTLHTNRLKHQIRVHLASGINSPILGDHKYSHFARQQPQKLHKEMLDMLKVRQAKVRHFALHLHCRSVVLTDYKGRAIFLTTRPPPHFKQSLESLKLIVPKKLR